MEYKVNVLFTEFVTHDVKSVILERPQDFDFTPGQSVEMAVAKPGWESEKRPFTITSHPEDQILEFTIKAYPDHHGVTEQVHLLRPMDQVVITEAWDNFSYLKPGVFIAGGTGLTPLLAIMRDLYKKGELRGNKLIFANKKVRDIIREKELLHMFEYDPERIRFVLSEEEQEGYDYGRVDREYLLKHIKDFNQQFYLCGPDPMVDSLKAVLEELGVTPVSIAA